MAARSCTCSATEFVLTRSGADALNIPGPETVLRTPPAARETLPIRRTRENLIRIGRWVRTTRVVFLFVLVFAAAAPAAAQAQRRNRIVSDAGALRAAPHLGATLPRQPNDAEGLVKKRLGESPRYEFLKPSSAADTPRPVPAPVPVPARLGASTQAAQAEPRQLAAAPPMGPTPVVPLDRDGSSSGFSGWVWLLLALATGVLGFLAWMLSRGSRPAG